MDELLAQMKTDEASGNLIPGGFDDIGEPTDELQLALETLHKAIAIGIAEKLQLRLASRIYQALAESIEWNEN